MEYMAVSILVNKIAKLKRAILNKAIKSPTVRLLLLLTDIANTSDPSMTAPPRMDSPIPAPKKKTSKNGDKKFILCNCRYLDEMNQNGQE
jgi:hypothetical protein